MQCFLVLVLAVHYHTCHKLHMYIHDKVSAIFPAMLSVQELHPKHVLSLIQKALLYILDWVLTYIDAGLKHFKCAGHFDFSFISPRNIFNFHIKFNWAHTWIFLTWSCHHSRPWLPCWAVLCSFYFCPIWSPILMKIYS